MDKNKLSLLEEIDVLRKAGKTWAEVATVTNELFSESRSEDSCRKFYSRNIDDLDKSISEEKDNIITRKSNGDVVATATIKENPANLSIEEIVEVFGLSSSKWECVGYTAKVWNALAKDGKHENRVVKNYSVKATFKPVYKIELKEEDLSWVFDFTKSISTDSQLPIVNFKREDDNVLVLPIFDAHIGKLAWGKETGENYDMKIASSRFRKAVLEIVSRAKDVGFSKIIFPLGNDFFQYDNPANETTRGTRVDSDIRWKKLFKVGITLLREALDYCKVHAPVDVILVQGNHDNTMSFYAFEALRGWYDNDDRVTIDKDIRTRTYRRIGVNLIGFTHGDKEKDNLYKIMQQEARELWGKTKYSEWIIGHYHKNYVDERQGVTKRVIGSFSGTDAWHYENGFIGTAKTAQGIIYNKKQVGPYLIIYNDVN